MKYIKKFEKYNESFDSASTPWEQGVDNKKLFVFYTDRDKLYITGCRTCDEVTPLKNKLKERQQLGNVNQSLCNCAVCNNYLVYDENKFRDLDYYLNNKDRIDAENQKNIKHGLHVNIASAKIKSSIEPTEVIQCEPFTYEHIHGNYIIDTLYVYAVESNTNDVMDNPLNNLKMDNKIEYLITIDLDENRLRYPYPESKINSYPKEVQEVFKKYISEYCK